MLKAQGLSRSYGAVQALEPLDLTIEAGQIFGLLGPNGAGKTTTIKMMTGLLRPTSGTVFVDGFDIRTQPLEAKRRIGYVADEPFLYEKLTPVEFLRFNAELYGVSPEGLDARIGRLLELFDLAERAHSPTESFSHGMKQKTALAGALVHEPHILFLDEPTVGLDPRAARRLKEILRRLAGRGALVVLSTHILEIAERLCDRVAILSRGRLLASGTVDELRAGSGGTLEEIFLEMTGGDDLEGILESLDG